MNLNATLFAQCVVFLLLAAFLVRYVLPPLRHAIDERIKRIADGIAMAERSRVESGAAQQRIGQRLAAVDEDRRQRLRDADARVERILADARLTAAAEAERILANANAEAVNEMARARDALRNEVAATAVRGAEAIMRREIDAKTHAEMVRRVGKE